MDRWSRSILGLVLLAACLHASGCATTTGVVGAVGVASKVRDVTALATRLVCRGADRASRGAGGPWVVPRSDAERAEDAAAGWFGEVTSITGGGESPSVAPPDEAPPESEPTPAAPPPDPADVARAVGAGTLPSGTGGVVLEGAPRPPEGEE